MSDFDDKATVTGAIASFNNGADEVPVDSGTFYIAPSQSGTGTPSPSNPRPIVGYTGMTIYQTGKNLLHNEMEDGTTGGIDYSLNSDGSIDCSGTVSNVNSTRILATNIKLPVGSYVLSGADSSINLRCVVYAKDGTSANRNDTGSGVTVSITADTDYIEFRVKARTNAEVVSTTIYPMFEVGSTPSQFEAYKAKTPIVDAFGRTIYGGERKTDGTLTESYGVMTFDGSENGWTAYSAGNGYLIAVSDMDRGTWYNDAGSLCDIFPKQPDNNTLGVRIGVSNNGLYVVQANTLDGVTDLASFKTWLSTHNLTISYPLATPNEYTLSPISLNTYYGDNNVWCDTGDTELTYYKSGYGYTSVTVNQKNGNDELIDSKTVKLHKVIYGGEVDVIKGTAEPKNLLPNKTYQRQAGNLRLGTDSLDGRLSLKSGTYTLSFDCDVAVGGVYYVLDGGSAVNLNATTSGTKVSGSFTLSNDTNDIFFYVYRSAGITDENVSNLMLESNSSASDYVPHFEPFTFTPISMETVEGTNVLYANEGDSTVTYRRSAE